MIDEDGSNVRRNPMEIPALQLLAAAFPNAKCTSLTWAVHARAYTGISDEVLTQAAWQYIKNQPMMVLPTVGEMLKAVNHIEFLADQQARFGDDDYMEHDREVMKRSRLLREKIEEEQKAKQLAIRKQYEAVYAKRLAVANEVINPDQSPPTRMEA